MALYVEMDLVDDEFNDIQLQTFSMDSNLFCEKAWKDVS